MENMVIVRVHFEDTKSVNNMSVPVTCLGELAVVLDRKFLYHLEQTVTTFKALGDVEILFKSELIAELKKDGYRIFGKDSEIVNFQRFGGKIAKDFYNRIDDLVYEIEQSGVYEEQ